MFSSGELILIGLVALIVIGPERLPRVARTVGALLGRFQRYVSDVKADISREMQIEDLKKLQQQVAEQAQSMERSVSEHLQATEASLNQSIATGIDDQPPAASAPAVADGKPIEPPKP